MIEYSAYQDINSEIFYDESVCNKTRTSNDTIGKSFTNIDPILKAEDLYICLCPKCKIIPFIEFSEKITSIFFTCLCQFQKKIEIKEFFNKKRKNYIVKNNDSMESCFLKSAITNDDYEELRCKKHHVTFKYFCKTCFLNICEKCSFKHVSESHELINLESIKIDNEKLNEIITKINPSNQNDNDNFPIENIKLRYNKKGKNTLIKINEEEENQFNMLIRIIINNYKNYPNISNYFNIKNIFHFFNINETKENDDVTEKESSKNNNIQSNEKDEIIIQYINNDKSRTNLFSKKFVKNNKNKVDLEIIGRTQQNLLTQHQFKSNEGIVTVKLIIKENVYEIDMSEMFANCSNLVSIDGIAKLKAKITSRYKMFYNCIHLNSIKDIECWKLSEDIDNYLMFYNCISLILNPNSVIYNNDIKNNIDLGILITKYLRNGKEIIIKTNDKDKTNESLSKEDNRKAFNRPKSRSILCHKKINNNNNAQLIIHYEK